MVHCRAHLARYAIAVLLGAVLPLSNAAAEEEPVKFDIPAQPAATGLNRYAEQADIQILFLSAAVRDVETNAVVGEFEKEYALETLLANTGLEIAYGDNNTATVRPIVSDEGPAEEPRSVGKPRPASPRTTLMAQVSPANQNPAANQEAIPNAGESGSRNATEEIVVTGRRASTATEAIGTDKTSNTVSVTRQALLSAPAGISGLKMLEGLPGFNVQTDGALGLYEFGNSVTVRAFNLQQIGFVLDGIPMGRSDAFGGSPIFRYVDNENLLQVRASPGAGDVSLPSYASLGPIVEYLTTEPSDEFAAMVSVALGDDDFQRTFVKVETGDLNGFSAYVSRSKTDSDLWRGAGTIDREHVEGKAQYEFDEDTLLKFQFVYNDFFDFDSPSMNMATYESTTPDLGGKTGRKRGYIGTIPDLGFGPNVPYEDSGYTYYYIDRVNIREDFLYGASFLTDITPAVDMAVTAYYEDKDGFGVSPEAYSSANNRFLQQTAAGLPVTAPNGVQYGLSTVGGDRYGVVANFSWELSNSTIETGIWYENDEYHRLQQRQNKVGGNPQGATIPEEIVYFRRDYTSTRDTIQFYLKDTIRLLDDRLTVEAGFKSLDLDFELQGFRDYDDFALADGSPGYGEQLIEADYSDGFLPMVGAVYELSATDQLFASYSENLALPRGADNIFSTATAVPVPAPDAETSRNFELGYRTNRQTVNAAVALFFTSFENRLQSFTVPLVGAPGGTETFYQNVGGVDAYGVEFTANWKPEFLGDHVYFNSNITYNATEFQDDYTTSTETVEISGNTLPDSPEWMVVAGMTAEPTTWIVANLSARYTGRRYSNFVNSERMESYTVWNAYVDIGEGQNFGPLKNLRARVNVDNVFDEDVLAFTFTSTTGNATFRPLSPRTVQFSVTADF